MNLEILYQDEHILVVNKPSGILSIPDRYDKNKVSLTQLLLSKGYSVMPVHRIDKDTSGTIVFALIPESHRTISMAFENHEVQKKYHAIIEGVPLESEGKIVASISADPNHAGRMKIHPKGKYSETHYRILEAFKQFAHVEFDLKTGRTHQIRVHAKHIKHPLAVDPNYGMRSAMSILDIKPINKIRRDPWQEEQPLMARQSLHAFSVEFAHPATGERFYIESPYPKDFKAVLQQLRKWQPSKI